MGGTTSHVAATKLSHKKAPYVGGTTPHVAATKLQTQNILYSNGKLLLAV
jgi:hypothetical protein